MTYDNNITTKRNAEWIKRCEDNFADSIRRIAEDICKKRELRIVRLFGPTCSGKTTAANILISVFESLGKRAHIVSIDDFYYDRETLLEMSRAKGLEVVDYDSPDTIDVKALHLFAEEIFDSDEVHCPIFDFSLGRRNGYKTLSIDENDIFIFEGIQANYPNVKEILSEHGSASIFIIPESRVIVGGVEILPQRLRLMRRLVRDFLFRSSDPEFTLDLWRSVRDNEDKNIFPYASESDYFVDSTMEYEVGVLKPYLCEILGGIGEESRHYPRAQEILNLIEQVEPISRDLILPHYLYREFV